MRLLALFRPAHNDSYENGAQSKTATVARIVSWTPTICVIVHLFRGQGTIPGPGVGVWRSRGRGAERIEHTHIHTYMYIYIHIYIHILCVCVPSFNRMNMNIRMDVQLLCIHTCMYLQQFLLCADLQISHMQSMKVCSSGPRLRHRQWYLGRLHGLRTGL